MFLKILFSLQVETVGQIYMVASGAPERNHHHAQNVADLSLRMMKDVQKLKSPTGSYVEVRTGANFICIITY